MNQIMTQAAIFELIANWESDTHNPHRYFCRAVPFIPAQPLSGGQRCQSTPRWQDEPATTINLHVVASAAE
jgi:hypothetical protein